MKPFLKFSLLIGVLVVLAFLGSMWSTAGAEQGDEPPERTAEIVVTFTQYQWWLTRWEDNQSPCGIFIEHEGLPTPLEVLAACGEELYTEWLSTPACPPALEAGGDTSTCQGLYLFLADIQPGQRTVTINLPVPVVWLSLQGCTPTPPKNQCSQIPSLVFEAEEPLPNEIITAVHVKIGEDVFDCEGSRCEIPMQATPINGLEIEFWADSSYGDESERFTARVRIVDGGVSDTPGENIWFVDVLSSQWRGSTEIESCAAAWGAFPPLGGPPKWLSTPAEAAELSSSTPYRFLAGQLIARGIVDTSSCPEDGLLPNGAANECGAQLARSVVTDWQNQFDMTILEVSKETSVPAQLLKNLFAQESQFWPGELIEDEFGLGQLTALGADSTLLWNADFFGQFCPLVLSADTCAQGYAQIEPEYQEMLRGALATLTNADCPTCDQGLDLAHATTTVGLFAETLIGNCEQVAYIVYDATGGETPGVVSSYEDLWRFTLVNYNAGPGCLRSALKAAWPTANGLLTWQDVSEKLSEGCAGAREYVKRVTSSLNPADPDFIATLTPFPTPQQPYPAPTTEATPTAGATPTQTPPPTATPGAYP